jgi:hypothetical protein
MSESAALISAHAGLIHRALIEAGIVTPEHLASIADELAEKQPSVYVREQMACVANALRNGGAPTLKLVPTGSGDE